MKFDMHCHTKEGSLDGKVPIEEFIESLRENGFNGMLVSDHNSYKGYRCWERMFRNPEFRDFVVLKGIEYDTIDAGHILVIMPEDIELKILELRGLTVQFLIDIVHKNGGILGPAHPCGEKYLSILNTRKHRNQLAVMDRFDFLEGFNACESRESNRRAAEIAEQFGLPTFGGSDAHRPDCVGMGFTEFKQEVKSESELIGLIREMGRDACYCGGEYYTGTTKERIGRAKNLLAQSFWLYNRLASLWRHRRRSRELKKIYIRIK